MILFEAIEFAVQAHDNQFRKGTRVPSVFHEFAVAKTLIDCGCSEEVVVAAILHDTVEDTAVTIDEISARFGDQVASLVAAVSEPDQSHSWEERKQHTLDVLETASAEVLLIQLADKLDNIRAIREDLSRIGETVWGRFKRGRAAQQWYYQALAEVLARRVRGECGERMVQAFQSEVDRVFGP